MQRIYYDSYDKKVRKTVWAETGKENTIQIHCYILGVYIDDIIGKDEHEKVITIAESEKADLFCLLDAENEREFFDKTKELFIGRSSFEDFEEFLDKNGINYSKKNLY